MTKSITTKLIIWLTSCSAAILFTGVALDSYYSKSEILALLESDSQTSIDNTVTNLDDWMGTIEGAVLFFGRILEEQEYSEESLKNMLGDLVERSVVVFGAAIAVDPTAANQSNGFAPYYYKDKINGLRYSDLAAGTVPYWKLSWYADAVKNEKPTWIEPYFDTGGAEILMTTFTVPLFKRDMTGKPSLYGVVTADVALDELDKYLQSMRLGVYGSSALLSRNGIFLSSKNPNHIMQHYTDVNLDNFTIEGQSLTSTFERALAGKETTGKFSCPKIAGDCIIRVAPLKSTGWPLIIMYSEDEHLIPLREYQTKAIILGLFLLLMMALMISIISRRTTRPLVALAKVTDEISHGDLDADLPESKGEDEVARLIGAFAAMKTNLKTYIKNLEAATAAHSRLEGELAAATEIQMAMLPQDGEAWEQAPSFSLWAKTRPAKTVGGDLFTFYRDSSERLFFAVGDVSDKGVSAALFMAKTVSHIQQYSKAFVEPAKGMALLNNALVPGNSNCMFVTLFFGVLDLTNGELRFASAGHTAPCHLRNGVSQPFEQKSNSALGLTENAEYLENRIHLLPGDRLAIYTDGIDEAFNERDEMYTSERLQREIEQHQDYTNSQLGEHVFQSLDEFAGSKPQSDDITLMILQFSQNLAIVKTDPVYGRFPLGPGISKRVSSWLLQELSLLALEKGALMDLLLVGEEVSTNIDKHAQLSRDSVIEVLLEKNGDDIHLEFRDNGVSYNPLEENTGARLDTDIESAETGGLGIHLIIGLTQLQEYRRDGETNIFRVTKTLY